MAATRGGVAREDAPTPEQDKREVQLSYDRPDRFDNKKLIRASNWQFTKWSLNDAAGFFGCWLIVGLILALLWAVLNVGS